MMINDMEAFDCYFYFPLISRNISINYYQFKFRSLLIDSTQSCILHVNMIESSSFQFSVIKSALSHCYLTCYRLELLADHQINQQRHPNPSRATRSQLFLSSISSGTYSSPVLKQNDPRDISDCVICYGYLVNQRIM